MLDGWIWAEDEFPSLPMEFAAGDETDEEGWDEDAEVDLDWDDDEDVEDVEDALDEDWDDDEEDEEDEDEEDEDWEEWEDDFDDDDEEAFGRRRTSRPEWN